MEPTCLEATAAVHAAACACVFFGICFGSCIPLPRLHFTSAAAASPPLVPPQVAAVSDAERGKQGALNAFLAERQHLLRPPQESDRLRAEVGGWVGGGGGALWPASSLCCFLCRCAAAA
jgi:hypothetical protein